MYTNLKAHNSEQAAQGPLDAPTLTLALGSSSPAPTLSVCLDNAVYDFGFRHVSRAITGHGALTLGWGWR